MKVFHSIDQICLVVPSLTRAIDIFRNELGTGPWQQVNFGAYGASEEYKKTAASITDVILDGKKTETYAIQNGMCRLDGDPIELELIQPIAGESIFKEYLDCHGAGCQHISIVTCQDYVTTLGQMAMAGNPVGQVARVDGQEDCAFIRHPVIGTELEIHQRGEDFEFAPPSTPGIPANRELHPVSILGVLKKIQFRVENQEQAQRVMTQYCDVPAEQIGSNGFSVATDGVTLEFQTQFPSCFDGVKGIGAVCFGYTSPLSAVEIMQTMGKVGRPTYQQDDVVYVDYGEELGCYIALYPNCD